MRWPLFRKKAEPNTPSTWPPVELEELSFAIFGAACRCAAHLKELTRYDDSEAEGKGRDVDLVAEHLGFFLNLADRTTFAIYGPEGRARLLDDLACWGIESTMQAYFGDDWPNAGDVVRKFAEWLTAKLEECQAVYGSCAEILGPPPPWVVDRSDEANPQLVSHTAMGRLSIRAAAICGHATNPEVLFQAIKAAVDEHTHMDLDRLVRKAGAALCLKERTGT